MALALWSAPALAQAPAEGAVPPPPPPPPPAVPADVPPPPMAPMTPPPAVATEAKPPTSAEAMPASRPDVLPPIDVGAWTRVGSAFQGTNPSKVNDWHMDNAYVELHAGGKIHKKVGVTVNLNANMLNFGAPTQVGDAVAVEDAIVSFDLEDELHVWAGHLLVPVDRANASGPFFMIPWNYPGFFTQTPDNRGIAAPHEGPSGRNNGVVVWGDIAGGKLTYLAGAFDNANRGSSPLFTGRVRLALWDPEPGFWGNGSFFGDKDMLSIGVGGQFQKHGSASMAGDKDYADINADLLVEKKLGGGAFVTGEGAYYHYNVSDGIISDTFYVLAAFATPTVGVGNIQPMARYQWEKVKGPGGTKPWNLDVGLSYLIKGPALRLLATYSHTDLTTTFAAGSVTTANAIQLGAQAIFF